MDTYEDTGTTTVDDHRLMRVGLILQFRAFRCLGYQDTDGKWRDFFRHDELPEPLSFTALEPEILVA